MEAGVVAVPELAVTERVDEVDEVDEVDDAGAPPDGGRALTAVPEPAVDEIGAPGPSEHPPSAMARAGTTISAVLFTVGSSSHGAAEAGGDRFQANTVTPAGRADQIRSGAPYATKVPRVHWASRRTPQPPVDVVERRRDDVVGCPAAAQAG